MFGHFSACSPLFDLIICLLDVLCKERKRKKKAKIEGHEKNQDWLPPSHRDFMSCIPSEQRKPERWGYIQPEQGPQMQLAGERRGGRHASHAEWTDTN